MKTCAYCDKELTGERCDCKQAKEAWRRSDAIIASAIEHSSTAALIAELEKRDDKLPHIVNLVNSQRGLCDKCEYQPGRCRNCIGTVILTNGFKPKEVKP